MVHVCSVPEDSPTKVTVGAIMHPEPRDPSGLREEHIGIIIGALAALILLLFAIGIFVLLRHQNKKQEDAPAYGTFEKHHMTGDTDSYKTSSSTNGVLPGYHMYNVVATSDADFEESTSFKKLKLTELYRDQEAAVAQKLGEAPGECCHGDPVSAASDVGKTNGTNGLAAFYPPPPLYHQPHIYRHN